jgi:hypothetical protein
MIKFFSPRHKKGQGSLCTCSKTINLHNKQNKNDGMLTAALSKLICGLKCGRSKRCTQHFALEEYLHCCFPASSTKQDATSQDLFICSLTPSAVVHSEDGNCSEQL